MSSYYGKDGYFYSSKGYILVHADGGDCHGTPLVGHQCPKCGIHPDMQSTEFWSPYLIKKEQEAAWLSHALHGDP